MTNINKNYQYFSKIFLELISNQDFKNKFQAFAPEIYAEIQSYSTNPNCSCRFKIEQTINTNKDKYELFINDFLNASQISVDLSKIEDRYKVTNMAGNVEKVKKSEWQSFRDKLINEKAVYRSFAVLPIDQEYVEVYFL